MLVSRNGLLTYGGNNQIAIALFFMTITFWWALWLQIRQTSFSTKRAVAFLSLGVAIVACCLACVGLTADVDAADDIGLHPSKRYMDRQILAIAMGSVTA